MTRLERFRQKLKADKLPAMLVSNIVNVTYLSGFSGFSGPDAMLLITPDVATLFTDARYTIQATRECPGFQVKTLDVSLLEGAAAEASRLALQRVAFEEDHLTVRQHSVFKTRLEKVRPVPVRGLVEALRAIKDETEIESLRAAARLVDETFEHILPFIKPGVTEHEIATEIDCYLRHRGSKEGFETIVASGYNAAQPHAHATQKKIAEGEMVKLDYGALVDGYHSDITRVVAVGPADETLRKIHAIVLGAQELGIAAIRPGVSGREVDAVARDFIAESGYGENFGHGLGHSLGLEIHDGLRLSSKSDTILEPGMVFTVEPGIYIEAWGGVRIEDDVLVTDQGHQLLTHAPKNLIEVG